MSLFKNKTYTQFIIYFLLYGSIISLLTSFVNYKIKYGNIEKEINSSIQNILSRKKELIKNYLLDIEQDISAIKQNPIFENYLQSPQPVNKKQLENLFLNVSMSNKQYFQVRFLNDAGKEVIRINKDKNTTESYIVVEDKLQDKSGRYYFKETIAQQSGVFWFSHIDLNIENKEIEQPVRPTIRVSTPVYYKGQFYGIIIINIDMSLLLSHFRNQSNFDIYLIDKDGYFLVHSNQKYDWSRFLGTNYIVQNEFPQYANKILENYEYKNQIIYSVSLAEVIHNNQGLKLLLKTQKKYIEGLQQDNYRLTLYLALLILIISVPVGLLLAISPAKIQQKLARVVKQNKQYLDLIDQYVITSQTDIDGTITDVSSKWCSSSGYSKSELIGNSHSIIKNNKNPDGLYRKMWTTISKGDIWKGEIRNTAKDGSDYWLYLTILPNFDDEEKLAGFTAIATDISDKKIIEYISEHDKLTQIYNRVKLDNVITAEFNRTIRYHTPFSLILLDIDDFKSVNDNYGHPVGDSVLIELATIIKDGIRKTDTAARWGGEEFMIVCTHTDQIGVFELAEQLRKKIAAFDFKIARQKTASFGVTSYKEGDTIESMIKRCDDALYKAKKDGKNRVAAIDS